MEARQILAEGYIWRVEDGHTIHIWDDKWLLQPNHKKLITPIQACIPQQFVSDIIHQDRGGWNEHLIAQLFLPVDIPRIWSIPSSHQNIPDNLIWSFSKDCTYSVRSGYHWLRDRTDMDLATTSVGRMKWGKLWKTNIPPKFKIFWRLLHNALPYNQNLQKEALLCQEIVEDVEI